LRAEEEERDIWRRLEKSRRINEWEQTPQARALEWRLFSPDWTFLVSHDSLSLRSLVALSVGLHPYFASEAWVFNVALPHFKSERVPDVDPPALVHDQATPSDAACRLDTFIRRLSVALSGCSAGTLRVCDNGPAGPKVQRAEFVRFAEGKRWSLPAELAASSPAVEPAPASEPIGAGNASWTLKQPQRDDGLATPIHRVLKAAHVAMAPRPTAREVLEAFRTTKPTEIVRVLADGCDFFDNKGGEASANLEGIRKRIGEMTTVKRRPSAG